jgi:mycofactocin precursor
MTSTVTESVVSPTTDPTEVDVAAVDTAGAQAPYDDEVLAELLIEEISIDGMCGVY